MKFPPSFSPKPGSRSLPGEVFPRGFTLLEVLMVCAIIAILVGLTVPLVGQLGRAKSLTGAGNHMADLLAAARQNSMAKNCLTVLLIPAGEGQWDGCILYQLRPKVDGSAPDQKDWEPASKWEKLPDGVTIDETTFVTDAQKSQLPAALPAIRRGDETIHEYRFVTFMPRGTLFPKTVPQGGNPYVRLVQGIRAGGRLIVEGAPNGATPANIYKIIVLSATGITKIERS